MEKFTYITIVNESYKPYLDQLIRSHQLFSKFDLIVYTINFELDYPYRNVKYLKYTDENLLEYEKTGSNLYIKNEYEKHKYTTLLKPKILSIFLEEFDYYFFIDSDILLTKNSDVLVFNLMREFRSCEYPISVKYFHQYSTSHSPTEPMHNEDGSFNLKFLSYYPLIELYGSESHPIHYLTSYCMLYNKKCNWFLEEAEKICFCDDVLMNYKKYLPLGDETVFNYLYSKYNFDSYISSDLCYDINPFCGISDTLNNLEKGKNFISFIHTKRYTTFDPYGKNFSDTRLDEYDQIFNALLGREGGDSKIMVHNVEKLNDNETIHFSVDNDYSGNCYVKVSSLFRPNKEYKFEITLFDSSVVFFIVKENDLWVKDTHLIIEQNRVIKDTIKII